MFPSIVSCPEALSTPNLKNGLVALVPWRKWIEEHLGSSPSVSTWLQSFFDDAIHVRHLRDMIAILKFIGKSGGDGMTNLRVVKAEVSFTR